MENWTLLTNHARVLLAIAGDPGIRLRDIAATLGITERSTHAIVTDLASVGYVVKHKHGCDGDACPARHAHGRLPRRGWQLPRRGRPADVDPDSIEVTVELAATRWRPDGPAVAGGPYRA